MDKGKEDKEDKEDAFPLRIQKVSTMSSDPSNASGFVQRKRPAKRRRLSVEHDDERKDYLSVVVATLNSNDEQAIEQLVFRLCTTDCVYMERYFEWLPVLPVYREMLGPHQIFNYLVTVYQCIPDALLKFIGSKLYERTDGTSYLIGRLKFSGIGFYNLQISDEVHNSPRFLSKDSMFSAIYGPPTECSSSTQARSRTQIPANDSHKMAGKKLNENEESSSILMAEGSLVTNAALTDSRGKNEEKFRSYDNAVSEVPISSELIVDDSTISMPQESSLAKIFTKAHIENADVLGTLVNRRNNRKKTSVSIPITPDKVIVSTAASQYSVGTRRKTPYKLDLDVTMVFHIDEEWKIWKIESCSHGEIKFKPN